MTAPFILLEAPVLVLALHSACHFIFTHTQKSYPREPCFSEPPAAAHEICLCHFVAVKVLVGSQCSKVYIVKELRKSLAVFTFVSWP